MSAAKPLLVLILSLLAMRGSLAQAADQPQWGQQDTRNMVSPERGLADSFEPVSHGSSLGLADPAANVRWVAKLGRQTYSTPVIAEGRVLVGTNNDVPRDKRLTRDAGILTCFDEATGEFLWQLVVPKLTEIRYGDFYRIGLTASPVVEAGLVYVVSNRAEVLCLDLDGLADGNDGPITDEGARMVRFGDDLFEPGDQSADILWAYDMVGQLGVQPHNASNCSVLSYGNYLYVCTSNGVTPTHSRAANPEAPTLIVLDKKTGRLVARDNFGVGEDIVHGQWSSPALGKMGDKVRLFQGAGNGVLYGFDPVTAAEVPPQPLTIEKVWWANGHPAAQTQDTVPIQHGHRSKSFEVIANPVVYNGRVYTAVTQDPFHHHREGVLTCFDASGTGDVTRSNLVWAYPDVGACTSTAAIADGLVYVAGHDGRLHCLDAETGKCHWVHDVEGPVWGSPLVADGKVYVGTERRVFWILEHDKTPTVLARIDMPDRITSTPAAANGTLYLATARQLYAIQDRAAQARLAVEAVRARQAAEKAAAEKAAAEKKQPPAKAQPKPEPKPAPEAKPQTPPEKKPDTPPKPEPAPQPKPAPAKKPETPPEKKPESQPKPEQAPAPEKKSEPAPQPKPAPAKKPETPPEKKPESQPKPEQAPAPEKKPESAPQPKPAPAKKPETPPKSDSAPTPQKKPESPPEKKPETPPKPAPAPAPDKKAEDLPKPEAEKK